ncbi:hypothetical protein Tco_0735694 [Tanacetum coccineum]
MSSKLEDELRLLLGLPWKGVYGLGKRGKLNPRYRRPFNSASKSWNTVATGWNNFLKSEQSSHTFIVIKSEECYVRNQQSCVRGFSLLTISASCLVEVSVVKSWTGDSND